MHMQKSFDQMNVHLHHAISDLTGVSGLAITDAILDGEHDPARLADLAHRTIRANRLTLIKALEGDWRPEHLFTLRQARQTHAHYQQMISECDQEIEGCIRSLEAAQQAPQEPSDDTPTSTDRTPEAGRRRRATALSPTRSEWPLTPAGDPGSGRAMASLRRVSDSTPRSRWIRTTRVTANDIQSNIVANSPPVKRP